MVSTATSGLFVEPLAQLASGVDGLAEEDLEGVPASCLGDDLRLKNASIVGLWL